jgi:hypothetical protein
MEKKIHLLVVLRPPGLQEPPRSSLSFHPPKAVKGETPTHLQGSPPVPRPGLSLYTRQRSSAGEYPCQGINHN